MNEWLVIGVAAGILLFLLKSRANYVALPEVPHYMDAPLPDVTIIIPARNEAHQIRRTVQSFTGLPVLVVDDASTDTTALEAFEAGARVMTAPVLAVHAKGKPNACVAGALQATTKWICFVDADTWFAPGFINSLVYYAEQEQLDAASAFLNSVRISRAEKLLLPYAFALYFVGVNAGAVNDDKSSECLANGQCFLFRNDRYREIGGHNAVLESVIEDVDLAGHAKRRGLHIRTVRAERDGFVRMYAGLGAIWNGFRKNSFRFLLRNPITGLQVVAASMLLTSWLPLLIYALRCAGAGAVHGREWMEVLCLFFAPAIGLAAWYRDRWALCAPLAIYLFQMIALDGLVSTLTPRRAVWKGRHV